MTKASIITLLSAAAFLGAGAAMAGRISDFNKNAHYARYHAQAVDARTIRLQGFPTLKIEDQPGETKDQFFLKLTYGGEEPGSTATVKLVPVHRPPAIDIPKLGIYEAWAKLLAINQIKRDAATGNPVADEGTERLLLVVRRTPEGFDADTWGSVRRTEWVFDFYEFKPDGTISAETRRWPVSANPSHEAHFQQRAADAAAGAHGKPPDPRLKSIADIPPIAERTLEYFAAMHVIPKLSVPKYKFNDTALSFHTLGWTLPAGMLSGLVFSISIFFALGPAKAAQPQASTEPRAST